MVDTHCLPNGSLGTGELPVPNISAASVETYTPASGLRRGVVVYLHGLGETVLPIPQPITNTTTGFLQGYPLNLVNLLTADGWVVIEPPYQEDGYAIGGSTGLFNEIQGDTGNGARYLASTLHCWDHVLSYIATTYGPTWPVAIWGFSEGGFKSLTIASHRQDTIVAYGAHCPATIWSNIELIVPSYSSLNTSGMDLPTTALDAVTIPGIVGYGTADTIVGYDSAGTGGTPVSNTDAIITNAVNAGQPVTRLATADFHQLLSADATSYANWFASTVDPLCPKVF